MIFKTSKNMKYLNLNDAKFNIISPNNKRFIIYLPNMKVHPNFKKNVFNTDNS